MQKRSFPVELRQAPIELDAALPICGGAPYQQSDRPVDWMHTHSCLELGYCFSGSGVFVVGEKIIPFEKGDISFINHTEPHLARSSPGTVSQWTWIYLDPLRLVGSVGAAEQSRLDPTPLAGPDFINVVRAAAHPRVGQVVLAMVQELREQRSGHESALRALCWQLMTLMHRQAPVAPAAAPAGNALDRLWPAINHIARHYMEPVDIALLATRCHLSKPQFRRLFVAATGLSPRRYWHDLRLRMAASLLRTTSRSIVTISQDVGFQTLSSFNRLFRARYPVSPQAWRQGSHTDDGRHSEGGRESARRTRREARNER